MFANAYVNSFYAGCKKVILPDLRGKPVICLSNNDGCMIARSTEAKRLCIRLGTPWFQLKMLSFLKNGTYFPAITRCMHASLSNLVAALLEEISPRVKQHSIDECFLDAGGISHCMALKDFGRQLREHSGTGLTIGVGMWPTKTLAKSAQWASKEWRQFGDVLALTTGNSKRMEITTALHLAHANPVFISENFSVVRKRTVRELNGESCITLDEAPPPKQQIVYSRSFGERVTTYEEMRGERGISPFL